MAKRPRIKPASWRQMTKPELAIGGFSSKTRRYVLKSVKNVKPGTRSISVRQYQQSKTGMQLEERATRMREGTRLPWRDWLKGLFLGKPTDQVFAERMRRKREAGKNLTDAERKAIHALFMQSKEKSVYMQGWYKTRIITRMAA